MIVMLQFVIQYFLFYVFNIVIVQNEVTAHHQNYERSVLKHMMHQPNIVPNGRRFTGPRWKTVSFYLRVCLSRLKHALKQEKHSIVTVASMEVNWRQSQYFLRWVRVWRAFSEGRRHGGWLGVSMWPQHQRQLFTSSLLPTTLSYFNQGQGLSNSIARQIVDIGWFCKTLEYVTIAIL